MRDDFEQELELAWAAGFFDGEGSSVRKNATGTNRAQVHLSINQKDRRVLDRFVVAVGHGRVWASHTREMFTMAVYGEGPVIDVMTKLWPYLDEMKREQFRTAVEWAQAEQAKNPTRGNGSRTCRKEGHNRWKWTARGRLCADCEVERHQRYASTRRR